MAEQTEGEIVLNAEYRGSTIYFPDGTHINPSGVEILAPLCVHRWDNEKGKLVKKKPAEIEEEARRRGANIVAERGRNGSRKSGTYATFRIEPQNLPANLGRAGAAEQSLENTATQTNVYWGSHDFDRTRPVGQRFVIRLSEPVRNLPLESLQQVGELPLLRWDGYQRTRYSNDEIAAYAQKQFGKKVIIVPSEDKRPGHAHFQFYRIPPKS